MSINGNIDTCIHAIDVEIKVGFGYNEYGYNEFLPIRKFSLWTKLFPLIFNIKYGYNVSGYSGITPMTKEVSPSILRYIINFPIQHIFVCPNFFIITKLYCGQHMLPHRRRKWEGGQGGTGPSNNFIGGGGAWTPQ